jgi:hypothetical protein
VLSLSKHGRAHHVCGPGGRRRIAGCTALVRPHFDRLSANGSGVGRAQGEPRRYSISPSPRSQSSDCRVLCHSGNATAEAWSNQPISVNSLTARGSVVASPA